ncbi:MAG: beta-propeller domain-containing protein [Candidatus Aenigmarchaeota archaeon]|nr:beta-propeller domain-containing protein [Candidatus Aenigmarchaeota archaeon]
MGLAFLVVLLLALGAVLFVSMDVPDVPVSEDQGVVPFQSEQDFKDYLDNSAALSGMGYYGGVMAGSARSMAVAEDANFDQGVKAPTAAPAGAGGEAERVSGTNVQVIGIDEPDIVKTDGQDIYFSSSPYGYWRSSYYYGGETKVIGAFPPEELEERAKIDKTGNLLLVGDTLVVFTYDSIYGYDVSDPDSPEQSWKAELNGSMVDARLYDGKIYLITRNNIDYYRPCPLVALSTDGVPLTISCSSIFHPANPFEVDVTYNAIVMDPQTGHAEKAVSFVGSSSSSVLYMSTNAIYVTYQYQGDILKIYTDFFRENPDLVPAHVVADMDRIAGYDISMTSKMTEFGIILQRYWSSLSNDERLRLENELSNRMSNYTAKHKRDLVRTGIAKISLDLNIEASGSVPGTLLNQFSLDEYEGNLRVAVTVGGSGWMMSGESANDVYVLDDGLDIVGSVLDMGLTERIYSVRFIQDKGYVVTFRQIDPFYVMDLSDPANPEIKGELKIPGYSSYLHPITKDKILGIGKEGSQVKISLFDVTDPENPSERSKYTLSEYWSDVLNTHHAFLLDEKHGIFFMPGSKGGYVFSYEGDELSLVKAVSETGAIRAIYIDDYLYIIGAAKITVLDENTWEEVSDLELSGTDNIPKPIYEGTIDIIDVE